MQSHALIRMIGLKGEGKIAGPKPAIASPTICLFPRFKSTWRFSLHHTPLSLASADPWCVLAEPERVYPVTKIEDSRWPFRYPRNKRPTAPHQDSRHGLCRRPTARPAAAPIRLTGTPQRTEHTLPVEPYSPNPVATRIYFYSPLPQFCFPLLWFWLIFIARFPRQPFFTLFSSQSHKVASRSESTVNMSTEPVPLPDAHEPNTKKKLIHHANVIECAMDRKSEDLAGLIMFLPIYAKGVPRDYVFRRHPVVILSPAISAKNTVEIVGVSSSDEDLSSCCSCLYSMD